mmetsp:Transcript_126931/g.395141  ORF Transcript_126931/g.395141 Transcript_126931/m.395141 type:complete len:460 (+) Transcript_126931:57-1436(+)
MARAAASLLLLLVVPQLRSERLRSALTEEAQCFVDSNSLLQVAQRPPTGGAADGGFAGGPAALVGVQNTSGAAKRPPGARVWLSQRALDGIALDVFPGLLARLLDVDALRPLSGHFMGFDWHLTGLRLADLQLRPPSLAFLEGDGLAFCSRGGFRVHGNFSVRGRSWYRFLKSEGSFSVPVHPGTQVAGIIHLRVSDDGKPAMFLGGLDVKLRAGSVLGGGVVSGAFLAHGAEQALRGGITQMLEGAISAFVRLDLTTALADFNPILPVRLPAPHGTVNYDFSLLGIRVASRYASFDLLCAPVYRSHPSLTYPEVPPNITLVPPPGFEATMATLVTTMWATDGTQWLLRKSGVPLGQLGRSKLPTMLASELASRLGFGDGDPSVMQLASPGALGSALMGWQVPGDRADWRQDSRLPLSAAISADVHWDLAPFLASKYGQAAATTYASLASSLVAAARFP